MIRTYYWNARILGKKHFLLKPFGNKQYYYFKNGNAGDLFAKELLEKHYGLDVQSIPDEGSRILTVGSILHFARPNDILCGIGYKPSERFDSKILKKLNILALRGPKTYDFLKAQGADLSKVKSLYDPGLLVRFLYQDLIQKNDYPIKNKISFLPHYRERNRNLMKQKNIHIIDIDNSVENVCKEILNSELIYTSSLHGLIFAHALNRPAVLVSPQTNEDMLKYEDYLASISLEYRPPFKDIHDAMKHNHSCSPISLNYKYEDIYLPDLELLKQHGVVV